MITVRLYTGQTLEFPDGTPEEVMRRVARQVSSGQFDLSSLRPKPQRPQGESETFDLSRIRRSGVGGGGTDGQPEPAMLTPDEKRRQMAFAYEHGDLGTVPGGTTERSPVRRAIDASAAAGSMPFRTLSRALDVAETVPEALGVTGAMAMDANVQAANLPRLPLAVAERFVRRGAQPFVEPGGRNLLSEREAVPDPLAPVIETTSGLRERATGELAEGTQHLPAPVAAGIFAGATGAGLAADASQYITARGRPFAPGGGRALTEAEQTAAVQAATARNVPQRPFDIIETAESPDLGIKTLDPGERLFVAVGDEGRDIGSLIARQEPEGGFRVRHVFVDEAHRGQSIPESLYRQAHGEMGPYLGSTDYLGRRTPAGEAMVARLRETAPEVFPESQHTTNTLTPEVLPSQLDDPTNYTGRYVGDQSMTRAGLTAREIEEGGAAPHLMAPDDYGVHYRDNGVEVTTPGGGVRFFRDTREASRWLGEENDRRLFSSDEFRDIVDSADSRLNQIAGDSDRYYAQQDAWREELAWRTEAKGILQQELGRDPTRAELDREVGRILVSSGRELDDYYKNTLNAADQGPLLPSPDEQAVRLKAAERDEFLRPAIPFKPTERGSIGAGGTGNAAQIPPPASDIPEHLRPQLPEEQVAEAMGWKIPTGSPRAVGPSTVLPEFQTNIPAQLGDDPQITNYVIQRSDEVFAKIGPPQTWDTLEEMATRLGTTKDEFLARSSHWSVLAPEARLRLLYVIKGNETDIAGLQSKLVAGTATDADKAELLRMIDTREDLIKLGAQTGSAYGRALNSLRMEARLVLGDDQLLRQQLYRQYSKQLDAEKPLMSVLARLDPNNPEELQAFLRAVNQPKWYEYAHEYWVSSILSTPASHLRNLIGNSVNAVMENAVVRPVAAGFDAARMVPAAEREIFLRETPAAVVGLTLGMRQGARRGLEVMRRGYDPIAMQGKLFPVRSAFARSQNRVVREVIGPVVTMPLRMLAASDALFKTMNWTADIYAQAARIASKEGLSGPAFSARAADLIANPTDEMIQAADAFALKATFNDDASAIGKAVMGLRDLPGVTSANPAAGLGYDAYRAGMGFVLPFIKIADRLMVRGLEYSPLGGALAVGARRVGNFAEAADLAARSSIGSAILAYGASLAMEGRLTAGAPVDEAERASFYNSNRQPWSVRTDDGVWIPFGGMQPIGLPFAIAAAAWKGWKEHGESPNLEKLGHAAAQVGAFVTDQSFLDGLGKLMDAIGGSERDRGRAFSDLVTNTAWGLSPYSGLTRSVARAIDPRVIDTETVNDRLKQNVPIVSLGMEARLTPWGDEVVPVGGRLRPALAPGSVLLPSKEKSNPLDQELARLGMPLGYVGKSIADRFGEGKSRGQWKLNQSEWHMYQQTAGRATKVMLERLFAKPGYVEWDIEVQRERAQQAIEAARKYARIQMVRYHRGFGIPGRNPTYGTVNATVNPPEY